MSSRFSRWLSVLEKYKQLFPKEGLVITHGEIRLFLLPLPQTKLRIPVDQGPMRADALQRTGKSPASAVMAERPTLGPAARPPQLSRRMSTKMVDTKG